MIVVGFHDPCIGLIIKNFMLRAQTLHGAQGLEDPARTGRSIIPLCHFLPVEVSAVQVAAVVPLEGILMVGIIVFLPDLITAVQDRDAALGQQESVEHDIQPDRAVKLFFVQFILGGLNAAEGSRSAAQAGVPQTGIIVVQLAAGITVIALAGQIIIEVFLVGDFLHPELLQILIVQSPADIIVAAQIVQEDIVVGQGKDRLHLVAEKPHVVRSHRMPGAGHRGDIVEHVALGLFQRPEIGNDLGGLHDDLAQEQGAGADDLRRHPHQAHQGVDLREIAAVCPQLFPDIGRRVQADDVHTVVAQVQHVRSHIIEDDRIRVIEVPLIGVKGRHDDLAGLLTPGEVSGCRGRKDLGDSLLKLVRNIPVVIEEIAVLVLLLPRPGPARPLMVLAGMVHDEVEADTHPVVMTFIAQLGQVLHGAEFRLYLPEIRNCIAAVAPPRRALQKGHQVDVVQTAFLQIIQMFPHALQGPCKAVGVHEHAQHLISLVPLRHLFAHLIPLPKLRRAL